jgi:hypothetical protein
MKDDMASNNSTLKIMALACVVIAEALSLSLIFRGYRTDGDFSRGFELLGLPLMALVPWVCARSAWKLLASGDSDKEMAVSRQITFGLIGAYCLFIYAVGSLNMAHI